MIKSAQPQIVKDYLDRLRVALVGLPDEVGHEILAGIAEELAGLDATEAAARIDALGDPTFIAAEARREVGVVASSRGVTTAPAASGDPRWYLVLASLLVAVGGFVIPGIGWIVGIVMVWLSKSWYRWEKWVATLLPLLFPLLSVAGVLTEQWGFGGVSGWHLSILSMFFMPFIVGIWLLWRGLGRDRLSPGR